MLIFEKHLVSFSQVNVLDVLIKMTRKINKDYICDLVIDENNNIVLYSFDNSYIDINNCPCALIYQLEIVNRTVNVYIMYIATKYLFRSHGYATMFIKEFLEFVNKKFFDNYDYINIIVDSIMDSVTFYEHFGFKNVTTEQYNAKLNILEEDNSEHFVMIYQLK